ncbi:UDP-N-acetylmuramyl-tripeptide synthetase, partial [Halorhodospira neutriphila]|nr:UDP-N-acetylmuramoyl-L-alanyl-D-glutamate--2,6-diaminopimelate ligase [Halorhodospira neutriphila]
MSAAVYGSEGVSLAWLLEPWRPALGLEQRVTGASADSRRVVPGDLFLALAGGREHGLAHCAAAIRAGAAAVAWDPEAPGPAAPEPPPTGEVPVVAVPGLQRHLGAVAARLYGEPSQGLEVVAVTGTDGKTSVSHFTAQLLSEPGAPCGVVGTLGHGVPGRLRAGGLTTPDAAGLQRALAECRAEGCRGVALEASSHALDQGRLGGTAVDVAVLTHLGRDHLDYHGSAEAYADAKGRLFELPSLRAQVLNADDPFGRRLQERAAGPVFTYSLEGQAEAGLQAESIAPAADGLELVLRAGQRRHRLRLPLIGRFNAANALAAAAAATALGRPVEAVLERLAGLAPVPGRMERLTAPGAPLVVVDYAHTPGALEQALQAVRAHTAGRLTVVFGCGGERDPGKRPLMGGAAARYADRVVLTDDNPRGEPPAAIRAAIRAGAADAAGAVEEVAGRAAAIAAA